jgi:anti-anti-sigma factor
MPAFPDLAITTYYCGRRSVLRLQGELDVCTKDQLRLAISNALERPLSLLIIDLSALSFMDCSGLSVLVRAHQYLAGQDCQLLITGAQPMVQRLIHLTGLDTYLQLSTTEPAAQRSNGHNRAPCGDIQSHRDGNRPAQQELTPAGDLRPLGQAVKPAVSHSAVTHVAADGTRLAWWHHAGLRARLFAAELPLLLAAGLPLLLAAEPPLLLAAGLPLLFAAGLPLLFAAEPPLVVRRVAPLARRIAPPGRRPAPAAPFDAACFAVSREVGAARDVLCRAAAATREVPSTAPLVTLSATLPTWPDAMLAIIAGSCFKNPRPA